MTPTPGLHRVVPNVPVKYSLATKVTGRNLAAVTYLVSLFGEAAGYHTEVTARFGPGGDLLKVIVSGPSTDEVIQPGEYIILSSSPDDIRAMSAEAFNRRYVAVD